MKKGNIKKNIIIYLCRKDKNDKKKRSFLQDSNC